MKTPVLIALAAGVFLLVMLIGARLIAAGGGVASVLHVDIAMWLGIVFTCLLGFGLMGAIFYSSRSGRDNLHNKDRRD